MGQKVNPHGLRVGVIKDWDSKWYAEKDFADNLVEDHEIRKFLKKRLYSAGISKIEIERASDRVKIIVYTAKPGVVIGKGGSEIEKVKAELAQFTDKKLIVDIKEVKRPDKDAQLVAENIAQQLENRISFRRAMKSTMQRTMKAGAKGIIFQYGNMYYPNTDIDQRDLREAVVGEERKVLCAMIHSSQAVELVKNKVKNIRLEVSQKEYDGESHNVIAELPGRRDEFIVLSAHYDSTSLSHGAYDNMSGCAGLLGIMEQLKGKELNYGLRFVFCGSEERGLLGSKAYVKEHKEELDKIVLNINLDMIGTYMGKFISCVSAEDKLAHYISYMAAEIGFPIEAKTGVYSSDSTPFADSGIPALSFARIASSNVAPIHCRYDVKEVMSMEQLQGDIDFLVKFTERFANAAVCPVAREIPEKIKKELDEYLARKRKEQ